MKLDNRLFHETQTARMSLILAIGLGLLGGVAIVGQARLLSRVVAGVFLGGQTLSQVHSQLLLFLLLSLVRAALVWGSEVAASRTAVQIKTRLREKLTAHLLALGPAYTQGEQSGELTNTVIEGVEALDAYFRHYLPQVALAALVPLTVLVFVFPLDWVSALVLLFTAPLIPIFMILIGSTADAMTKRQWTSLSRMNAHFLDILQGLTTLKLFGRSREQIQTIAQISDQFRMATMGVLRVAFLSALVLEMVATISTAVVAVQIGLRLLYGHLSFEQAFFVLLLTPEFYLPLRLLGTRFHTGMEGVAAAQRIFEVLGTGTSVEIGRDRESEVDFLPTLELDFTQVYLAYDAGQRPALNGLSFVIHHGEKVAMVGPSGAGKSTVAHLLLRFIEPDRGTVSVNGQPLHEFPAASWRKRVAWLSQNPYLFYGSVTENIRLGRPGATLDEVIWAARQAHAHDFIEALPHGYDTQIGERGNRLSGGEAQRVALARAFIKDAPFLILDEAAANLDPEVEALVQEALQRLLQRRTALIIAHCLSTVYQADRILVLDKGRVVQNGTHSALLEQDGLYRQLIGAYGGTL